MIVCGIDPSLVRSAVCVSDHADPASPFRMQVFSSKPRGKDARARMARVEDLVGRICDWLEHQEAPPDLILLEGYSYGSQGSTVALAEFGGILRWNLLDVIGDAGKLYEVAPGTLKKFVTGKGNAPKDQMGAHVAKRYGHVFAGDDEVDAFSLWQMATCCVDPDRCATAIQFECVQKVLGNDSFEDLTTEEKHVAELFG